MTANLPAKKKADGRRGIRPNVREAIKLMTWGDDAGKVLDRVNAAKVAGVTPQGMRKAMDRPDVIALMRQEKTAAREALTCSVPARLYGIAHQDKNMNAAVQACRALEQLPDDAQSSGSSQRSAGMQIVVYQPAGGAVQINNGTPAKPPMVDVTPDDLEPDNDPYAEHFASAQRPDPYRAPPEPDRSYAAPAGLASAPPWPPAPPRQPHTRTMRRT